MGDKMITRLMLHSLTVLLLSAPVQAQTLDFERYKVPLYTGPRAQPVFTGEGAKFAHMQTRIREAFAANEIAAGHYIVLQIGCGTGCTWNIVGDVRTGHLIEFPLGGETYQGLTILTDPKSRLFTARWDFERCTTRTYSLEGTRFVQVGRDEVENKGCF
jgi:hypothetical protein